MKLAALLDPAAPIPEQVASVLRIAAATTDDLLLLVQPRAEGKDASAERLVARVRSAVDRSGRFRVAAAAPAVATGTAEPPASAEPDPPSLRAVVAAAGDLAAVARQVAAHGAELLLVTLGAFDPTDPRTLAVGRDLLPRLTCRVAVLRPGPAVLADALHVLVPIAPGPHVSTSLRLVRDLVRDGGGRATALYVEPPIGRDAEQVGRRALERLLAQALGDDRDGVDLRVVVDASIDAGIASACADLAPDVVVIGTWLGELGARFAATRAGRMLRKRGDTTVLAVRRAIPFTNRLRRRVELALQNVVPQLGRERRVELFERVQSNSAWNFDFVALISLSTFIAALGLLQDSVAVVIGAMLVAPLMTPILGVGLALAQGNAVLARGALRTIGFGVLTAFVIALVVGLCDPGYAEPTGEMAERGWPGIRDLFVAFVSGLAAAYATSRSSLSAALPGVAIAAALVPPIATSGLAIARGDLVLGYGALLLFVTNMIAIVVAASLSLRLVGVRSQSDASRWVRPVGPLLGAATLALALHLATRADRPQDPLPLGCRAALRAILPADQRLASLELTGDVTAPVLSVRLGGAVPPPVDLADRLRRAAVPFFDERLGLRLTHVWETTAQTAPRRR
ncbi:MAG: DUF389 domain-containing protein [Planctomycetes bacterium]|nr:DUF389 domain-containing protein [Planctomycetota bacterium]